MFLLRSLVYKCSLTRFRRPLPKDEGSPWLPTGFEETRVKTPSPAGRGQG